MKICRARLENACEINASHISAAVNMGLAWT
jgi:hypothetical protein